MAEYKYPQFLKQINNVIFDNLSHPGTIAPFSGIYRCEVCGHEAVSTHGHVLPPQNHHTHPNRQPIIWRLIVASTHM